MSDDWIRIVPSEPSHVPSAEHAGAVLELIVHMMPLAEEVSVETSDIPRFIDAGVNQGPIRCPHCGADVDPEWWSAAIDESFVGSAFADRTAVLPCCDLPSDLNDLDYGEWPVAFARWCVECMNPMVGRLDEEQVRGLATALAHPVTVVYQHI